MPLVKVKPKFQVTIPTEVREAVQIAVGDILEATVQGMTIVFTPKAVDRAEARTRSLRSWTGCMPNGDRARRVRKKRRNGLPAR